MEFMAKFMGRYELILKLDGALWPRIILKFLLTPKGTIQVHTIRPSKSQTRLKVRAKPAKVYMGVCGGAGCAGKYWQRLRIGTTDKDLELFDFLLGVSLHYDANAPAYDCVIDIDRTTFQMTCGAALAVHIENDIATASSFPCSESIAWERWCAEATPFHSRTVYEHAQYGNLSEGGVSGPWWHPSVGTWYFSIRGTCVTNARNVRRART